MTETARKIEALLFLSPEPLALGVLAELVDADRDATQAAIDELVERHSEAGDRKSTRLNSSHIQKSRMPSSA